MYCAHKLSFLRIAIDKTLCAESKGNIPRLFVTFFMSFFLNIGHIIPRFQPLSTRSLFRTFLLKGVFLSPELSRQLNKF